MDKEELKDFLKTLKAAGFKADDIEVNVVSPKKDTIGNLNALKDEIFKEKPEPAKEPSLEKAPKKVATLSKANTLFAKAIKDAIDEFYQLADLTNEILKENQELRAKLGEK